MKKRITYVIISVVLLVVILTPIVSKADSGWDSDYDIGGWDSGGSWDFGGDWSSSSDWGSAGDIIILGPISLIIIIVIFIIVSKVSDAKNNDWEKDKPLITNSKFNIDYNDITQKEIDEIDSTIKIDEFKKKAFKIYKDIQEAWMNFDTDTIRKLTTDEMYNMYSSQLETLKLKHQKNIMKNIEYVDANITNITKEDGVISVVVYLRVKCLDYVINEKTKKTLRGKDNIRLDIQYLLVFVKSETDNKKVETCPNCGAPVDIISSATCPYCDSTLVKNASDYVLSKKTCIRQRYDK